MVPACWTQGIWMNPAIVAGNAMIDEAKIGGITPAVLILRGMCVLWPPNTRRPTTRLAYCTGILRLPVSRNTMAAITPTIPPMSVMSQNPVN